MVAVGEYCPQMEQSSESLNSSADWSFPLNYLRVESKADDEGEQTATSSRIATRDLKAMGLAAGGKLGKYSYLIPLETSNHTVPTGGARI
jgi:hypothetical protein